MRTGKKSLNAKPQPKSGKVSFFVKFIRSIKNIRVEKKLMKVIGGISSAGLAALAVKFIPWKSAGSAMKSAGSAIYKSLIRIEESYHALQARQTAE
jgi:hypothetical protein